VTLGEFALEEEHFKYHRDVELDQLRGFLVDVGLEGNLLEAVVSQIGRNDASLMKMMQAFEFGAGNEVMSRNPLVAMVTSGRLFLIGSIPTVLPFFWADTAMQGLWTAGVLVALVLFLVGAYKSRSTKGNWVAEGVENLCFGVGGTAVSYAVGMLFEHISGDELGY
jgi:VIT1/CCC1 family predicted Fe2+/Mn2+ transporter